jgi:hypothetical protein
MMHLSPVPHHPSVPCLSIFLGANQVSGPTHYTSSAVRDSGLLSASLWPPHRMPHSFPTDVLNFLLTWDIPLWWNLCVTSVQTVALLTGSYLGPGPVPVPNHQPLCSLSSRAVLNEMPRFIAHVVYSGMPVMWH